MQKRIRGFRFESATYPLRFFRFYRKKSVLRRHNTKNSKLIFPGKELRGPVPIFQNIREKMFSSGVNDTRDKEKHFRCTHFSYFVKILLECTLHFEIELLLIFLFQIYRQAILSALTPAKNLSAFGYRCHRRKC